MYKVFVCLCLSVSYIFRGFFHFFSVRLYFTLTVESIHPCHCLVLPFTFPDKKKTDGAVQLLTPQLLRPPHGGLRVVYLQRVRLHQGRGGAEREGAGALRAGRFQVRETPTHILPCTGPHSQGLIRLRRARPSEESRCPRGWGCAVVFVARAWVASCSCYGCVRARPGVVSISIGSAVEGGPHESSW